MIEGAIAQLDSFYVFPEVAKRMADSLRGWNSRGRYDAYTQVDSFAAKLNEDVRDAEPRQAHARRLQVRASSRRAPPTQPTRTPEDVARDRSADGRINCGFVKAEQLEGNVGYVKFNGFFDVDDCGPTASRGDELHRRHAGAHHRPARERRRPAGDGRATSRRISSRRGRTSTTSGRVAPDETEEFWTRDDVPGRRFGGEKPVYVLTSSNTFSGAEEFTYNLKTQKRATIVGETTGGGAHPVSGRRIDEHFIIGVPFARAINPITHTNWEGTGVEPDVKVPAATRWRRR